MTLSLNKIRKGEYSKQVGDIKIEVSKWNDWTIVITDESKTLEGYTLVNEVFDTKKQCMEFGTKWVIENL
jgi:hypothetical protein